MKQTLEIENCTALRVWERKRESERQSDVTMPNAQTFEIVA